MTEILRDDAKSFIVFGTRELVLTKSKDTSDGIFRGRAKEVRPKVCTSIRKARFKAREKISQGFSSFFFPIVVLKSSSVTAN